MIKPWYEQSFGNDYMIVYKHRDWESAIKEVRQMADWLKLPKASRVLDIGCGMGRHALALAEIGYEVTGIDLSDILLGEARKHDSAQTIEWVQGDMRNLPFREECFDATVNLFTSFGYFSIEEDNINVLRHIRRVLRPGGAFLIDFLNPVFVEQSLIPYSERIDSDYGLHIEEIRSIQNGYVQKVITISDLSKREKSRQYLERVHLLTLDWFVQHLADSGLKLELMYGNYDGSSFNDSVSPRMIMVGKSI